MAEPIPAVFVTPPGSLSGTGGGVQLCTAEYVQGLERAGFRIHPISYVPDRRIWTRAKNRLLPIAYPILWRADFASDVISKVNGIGADYVFLNLVVFGPLVKHLRKELGNRTKLVLLSHGLESVDYIHTLRTQHLLKGVHRQNTWQGRWRLGRQLVEESEHRAFLDQVVCLSPFEAEIERWLGAKKVQWIPRVVKRDVALRWEPVLGRFGYVGSLDHPPNYAGLIEVLEELSKRSVTSLEIRLVGGPREIGLAIAEKYRFIKYCGALTDRELDAEAMHWTAALHPIFCLARGCSTKLAIALSWQIPILATLEGCRGYTWCAGELPCAHDSADFADWVCRLMNPNIAADIQSQVRLIVGSSPELEQIASALRNCLLSPNAQAPWETDRSRVMPVRMPQ